MTNCKYKLRKLSVGLVSVGTMLIAPTVLGQEVGVSSTESSTTSTASASTDTSGTAVSEAGSGASDASVVSSEGSQSSESAQASTQPQAQTATATSSSSSNTNGSSSNSGDSDVKAPKAVTSSTSPSTPAVASSDGNQATGTEVETPMMEVEQYTVDNKATELNIKDGKNLKNGSRVDKNTKLIRNRDDEQRDIVDIKREVKTNADGTIDVTVTVTPKEIDKGADVMALLDVSKKMTEDDFKNAKDKIKKLVTTLTSRSASNSDNDEHKHNSRNSVRLMTFYRKVNEPIQLTAENVDKTLDEVWKKAKEDWNWGVDLQGAIHKAREIFNKEKEKKSGKRQHIVLFSQGESTFSYDIKNKNDRIVTKTRITEKVTTSNPLLPGLPIFNHTNQKADMLDDIAKVIKKIKDLGVKSVDTADSVLSALRALNGFGSLLTGSMTEYITLKEYDSDKLEEKYFDYTKRAGEGYYYHSFSDRKSENKMPFENELQALLGTYVPKLQDQEWIKKFLDYWDLTEKAEQTKLNIIMKVIKSIFYKREYHYYNHNLSAIAEAKMAQKEGITFYSVDVTDSDKASKRVKRQVGNEQSKKKKEDAEKDRNEKFDNYLKKMSEGDNFLSNVEERDKFKDTLTKLTIKDEFDGKVSVDKTSYQSSSAINYSEARNGFWSPSKESLTWTISKEQLKEAFEKNSSLTFKYKLRVNKNKLLGTDKKTTKRDTPTEDKTSVTAKIISNTTTYKINDQEVKDNKLDDVSLTYSKFKVPVPQIDGHVIEPQAPKLPELPPVTERGPVLDYTEESIYRLPLEHGSNAPDTQVTIEEDTVPQR
ncbi:TPA: serum opacification factor, partial [Streptococcus pyogenes]|nr:VWA domain-containing protein [Streptococcus pyogenes]HER4571567.1 VWA domain-containing protein [Streptococcus pyogenes NGAS641]HEP1993743.1 VWA domain-containing protein [Streptococcus pyogenes]HEP6147529.1 VWA domain-containing protein [Streptococcus pyogenes]HEQ0693069.1 VWA domain-containing protein [Streptococcus pyogenes]